MRNRSEIMELYTSMFFSSLLLVFISMLFLKKWKNQVDRPNHPPSPPKLPIIGNLHQLGSLPHRSLCNLANKYGPVMLMHFGSKPTLIISSAETAREVLQTYDLNFCTRPSQVGPKRLSYNFRDFVFTSYGDYWRNMKKIFVVQLFSSKSVQSTEFVMAEEVSDMIDMMKSIAEFTPSPINLTEIFFSLTNKITSRVTFGKSYQGRNFEITKFVQVLSEAVDMLASFSATDFFPYVGWIIDVLTGFSKRLEKCFNDFDRFYQQVIDEHLDPDRRKPEHEDIIDILLGLRGNETLRTNLTINHIKGLLMNMYLGGIDNSAATMVWVMAELIKKPEAMKKVREEIRNYVGKKGKVEASDMNQLQYFKMVIKETFRLHPPGVLLLPRECMKHCKINGYDIFPKTRVLVNVWAIGRSSEHWENPAEFIPERFMDSSIDFRGQDFELLPFGSGRRGCPGTNMAMATIELGLANLLYCFDWELPNKQDINMDEVASLTVHKKIPLIVIPTKYVRPI